MYYLVWEYLFVLVKVEDGQKWWEKFAGEGQKILILEIFPRRLGVREFWSEIK